MHDNVTSPKHYTSNKSGVECIDVIEHLPFNVGAAIKYLWRLEDKGNPIQDMRKALWFTDREIRRRLELPARRRLIYLACAYSHQYPGIRQARYEQVSYVAAKLRKNGVMVYAPISETHSQEVYGDIDFGGFDFWSQYNYDMIARCDGFAVLDSENIKDSVGVRGEYVFAKKIGLPIYKVNLHADIEEVESIECLER